jgi:uncharacterized membrane protein
MRGPPERPPVAGVGGRRRRTAASVAQLAGVAQRDERQAPDHLDATSEARTASHRPPSSHPDDALSDAGGWNVDDRRKERTVAIGPVQLIVLGFEHPQFHGEIIAELERLKESDTVRVIDSLAVYKAADGEVEVEHLSNLSEDEARELGSKVGALIGLGIEGDAGIEAGAEAGAEAAADGIEFFSEDEAWDVLEEIPNDSAAALILLEHHWAVPLRDAIARAGGFRISDGFISPLDLVAIGLMTAEEAKELHAMETAAAEAAR